MNAFECNFDGLVGPTHNYSGLSYGNVASVENQNTLSNPRAAALQGLEKMKYLHDLGIVQGILPPHERPCLHLLRSFGYSGSDEEVMRKVFHDNTRLAVGCCSAAAMWTANAATVSPSCDTADKKVHFTPANLLNKFHRSIEADTTSRLLCRIFNDDSCFVHHPPLCRHTSFSDEGAANHSRFCRRHGEKGVELFVWGGSAFHSFTHPQTFPARQTLEASETIARLHGLTRANVVFAQQSPQAIDAGAFHNDVISVGNENIFLVHEEAFVNQKLVMEELKEKTLIAAGASLILLPIAKKDISVEDSVASYLFNSQIVTLPDGSMIIIAPEECKFHPKISDFFTETVADTSNPIARVHYVKLRESMRNGGGPACLRLRVVLNKKELHGVHKGVLLDSILYTKLKEWIHKFYRDRLVIQDFLDPIFLRECQEALEELTEILDLPSFYEFQQ